MGDCTGGGINGWIERQKGDGRGGMGDCTDGGINGWIERQKG